MLTGMELAADERAENKGRRISGRNARRSFGLPLALQG